MRLKDYKYIHRNSLLVMGPNDKEPLTYSEIPEEYFDYEVYDSKDCVFFLRPCKESVDN